MPKTWEEKERKMISMEEYLWKKKMIGEKEPEKPNGGRTQESKENGKDAKQMDAKRWGMMMELAELLYI